MNEAKYMHNCLWLRAESYLNNKWFYAYMRKVSNPSKPFIDIVITKESNTYEFGTPTWIILKEHEYVNPISDEGKAIEKWYLKCFGQNIVWPKENKRANLISSFSYLSL